MKFIEPFQKLLQTTVLLTVLIVVGSLIIFPDSFGSRAAEIFRALERHGLSLELGTTGLKLSRTSTETVEAYDTELVVDTLVSDYPCLSIGNCDQFSQQQIADLLGIGLEIEIVRSVSAEFEDRWIVIFGADINYSRADVEIERLRPLGYELSIILKDDLYRSVAMFRTQAEADEALPSIRDASARSDAYIRLLSRWCPQQLRIDGRRPMIECNTGE